MTLFSVVLIAVLPSVAVLTFADGTLPSSSYVTSMAQFPSAVFTWMDLLSSGCTTPRYSACPAAKRACMCAANRSSAAPESARAT